MAVLATIKPLSSSFRKPIGFDGGTVLKFPSSVSWKCKSRTRTLSLVDCEDMEFQPTFIANVFRKIAPDRTIILSLTAGKDKHPAP